MTKGIHALEQQFKSTQENMSENRIQEKNGRDQIRRIIEFRNKETDQIRRSIEFRTTKKFKYEKQLKIVQKKKCTQQIISGSYSK